MLVDTQTPVDSWRKFDFLLNLQIELLNAGKDDFDQWTACEVPFRWSKYTTVTFNYRQKKNSKSDVAACFLGNGKALVLRVLRYYCFKLQSNFRYNYPHQSKALIATDAVSVSAHSRKTLHPLFFSLSLSLSLSLCDVRQSNRIIDLASCNRKSLTKEKTSKQKKTAS